eukprot:3609748-Pleurochrysis_carterae.AAC.1
MAFCFDLNCDMSSDGKSEFYAGTQTCVCFEGCWPSAFSLVSSPSVGTDFALAICLGIGIGVSVGATAGASVGASAGASIYTFVALALALGLA